MKFLVMDLETKGKQLKVDEAGIAINGMYDPEQERYYIYKWSDKTARKSQELFDEAEFVLSFNGDAFDWPILERHGVQKFGLKFDVMKIYKRRGTLMRYGGFKSHKLEALAVDMGIAEVHGHKGLLDYSILNKDSWTPEEQKMLVEYCKQDLKLTWLLWLKLVEHFDVLKEWISPEDAAKYKHVTTSPGSYVYKALCYATGLPEVYPEEETKRFGYEGAYVSDPVVEVARVPR